MALSRLIPLGGLLLAAAMIFRPAAAAPAPVVVELFTSQGCSSCPPADDVLAELAKRGDVLALAFHVDYWDRLGWKDPFSSPDATARQRAYARSLGKGNVYTPQMMIAGQRDVIGSERDNVLRAIAAAPRPAVALSLARAKDGVALNVGQGAGEARLWLVRFDPRRETQVRAGENAGRKLVNVNIVRRVETLGAWRGEAQSLSVPVSADDMGLAVLLQAADGRILGAASMTLSGVN